MKVGGNYYFIKKKKITVFILMLSIFGTSQTGVFANGLEESTAPNLEAEIDKANIEAAVEDTDKLNEQELNKILEKIGYSDELISEWTLERKRSMASRGGVVLEPESIELVHEYVSTDGSRYEITDENKEEVRDIQLEDLEKMGVPDANQANFNLIEEDTSLSTFSTNNLGPAIKDDGPWSMQMFAVGLGTVNNQRRYVIVMDFHWSRPPLFNFGEFFGMNWGQNGQPVSGQYTNSWTPNNWNISVSAGSFSMSGILTSAPRDEWSWRMNFIAD